MRKVKAVISALLFAVMLFGSMTAFSSGLENEDQYNTAILQLESWLETPGNRVEELEQIASSFDALQSYKMSRDFAYFSNALVKALHGKFDLDYKFYIRMLEQNDSFRDYLQNEIHSPSLLSVSEMISYVKGLEAESNGDIPSAIGFYAEAGHFYDAGKRYESLLSNYNPVRETPAPTPEAAFIPPVEDLIPIFSQIYPGINAAFKPTEGRWFSRFGPGNGYADGSGGFKADSGHSSWLTVYYAENDWVLAHIVYSSAFERYAYLPRYSISLSGNLPQVSELEYIEGTINANTIPLWGPDESFNRITECAVAADTEIRAFFRENDYVFAEFTCSYGLVRMWLPLDNVSFHESQNNS